jgi:hypothetical protein
MPSYSGVFTLQAQMQAIVAGLWPINGPYFYVEDVFSTYLYTGTSATNTITNGIDLSGKGGLVWIKNRTGAFTHSLTDTSRGVSSQLRSNATNAATDFGAFQSFNSSGFTVYSADATMNESIYNYVSWTFREQPKFFDIVTWTGNNASGRAIPHNLGSVPGCIIVKVTNSADNWVVWHRSLSAGQFLLLNGTNAVNTNSAIFTTTSPTSSVFYVGTDAASNASTLTYVAYLFAHDAGGFGDTGTDNVISCSSFTTDGSGNAVVNLGYEPQWLMVKNATTASNNEWRMVDNMRGFPVDGASSSVLTANTADAEFTSGTINVLNTGFQIDGLANSATFIYIAIRRGPMQVPTMGTSVFGVGTRSGSASIAKTNSNILTDLTFIKNRTSSGEYWAWTPRLNGNLTLQSNSTDANLTGAMTTNPWDTMTGAFCAASNGATNSGSLIDYSFRRAPGFFDVVCYTGTGVARTINHNLAAVPELMIIKCRNAVSTWPVFSAAVFNISASGRLLLNETTGYQNSSDLFNSTAPTSSVFTLGSGTDANNSGSTYVAYLFATVAGVSKVGSYTGTGATLNINAGFTTGARFVMIKRTDSTGDWFVWDTARGMVAGTDPRLALNLTAAESNANWVYTASTGFQIVTTDASVNASGGSYIYLAIA